MGIAQHDPYRNDRANMVSAAIEGRFGWQRDPREAGVMPIWAERYPNLPYVADGRDETDWTYAGRGTTAFDKFRLRDKAGTRHKRADFLSLKTDGIYADGKLPSKLSLTTGNRRTLDAILEGANNGHSFPTLVFASPNLEDGSPDPEGLAIFLDLAVVLRQGVTPIEDYPEGGYGKGRAPLAYMKWSAARKSGTKGKGESRAHMCAGFIDQNGNRWESPTKVSYPELVVSLSQFGIRRDSWERVHVQELPEFLENYDWDAISI